MTNETITLCIAGDDCERTYTTTYTGTADFPSWDDGNGGVCGVIPVALIDNQGREHLVANHPEHGWCSGWNEVCREFSPALDESRLESY